jgi:hypothetical protein
VVKQASAVTEGHGALRRLRASLRNAGGKLRRSAVGGHIRDLWMLALPYQVAAVVTALVAVGFTKLFMWTLGNAQPALVGPRLAFKAFSSRRPPAFLLSWWLVRCAMLANGRAGAACRS